MKEGIRYAKMKTQAKDSRLGYSCASIRVFFTVFTNTKKHA